MNPRNTAIPGVVKWSDLFESQEPIASLHKYKSHTVASVRGDRDERSNRDRGPMTISSFCAVRGRRGDLYFDIKPRERIIATVFNSTLFIDGDVMNFDVIVWDNPPHDGTQALVLCKHSMILGDVWLAKIDPNTIPGYSDLKEEE